LWLVGCGRYRIIGDSLAHNSQETIVTIGTASFVVKTVKQEFEVDDIFLQSFVGLAPSVFIELFDSSSDEDLTPLPWVTKSPKAIIQSNAPLSSKSSTPMGNIMYVVSCLLVMVLRKQTSNELRNLDDENTFLQKIQLFPIAFNEDFLFELSLMLSTAQGTYKKYNGHAWCKLVTINIKHLFGINFKNVPCLGHLWCVQDDYKNFVGFASCNETFWCSECIHIPIVGQTTTNPFTSSLRCKFYHVLPFCVANCNG
jgi:hypothetical protein